MIAEQVSIRNKEQNNGMTFELKIYITDLFNLVPGASQEGQVITGDSTVSDKS